MRPLDRLDRHVADLHWLAFLLTSNREQSLDLAAEAVSASATANPYFKDWMSAWSRRVVIAKALTAVRDELAASARRTENARISQPTLPARDWTLRPDTTKSELEDALLAIDSFPRAALVLSIFEGVAIKDSAVLLDATPELVKKGRALALQALTSHLAAVQGWTPAAAVPCVSHNGVLYA